MKSHFKIFRKSFLLIAFTLILLNQSIGQKKYTIANLGYMGSWNAKYSDPSITSDCGYLSLNLSIPVVINERTAIVAGIRANQWTVNYSPEQIWPTTFYSMGLTLGVNHKISKKNTFLFVAIPKLNSDYKKINGNAFQLGFISTYSFNSTETFLWKLGVYYNSEFFGPFVVPIIGLDWQLNEKLNISGDLPIYGKVNYQFNQRLASGLGYIALVSSYRLTGEFNNAYTSRFAIEPYLYADTKLFKNTYFTAKFGYAISRKYPVYAKYDQLDWQLSFIKFGDNRTPLNPVIENGAFVEFNLAYKIDIP
jgi:hypothetical protein